MCCQTDRRCQCEDQARDGRRRFRARLRCSRCSRLHSQYRPRHVPLPAAPEAARTPRRRHRGIGVRAAHDRSFERGPGPRGRRRARTRQHPFVPGPPDPGGSDDQRLGRAGRGGHDLGDARLSGHRVGRRLPLRASHLRLSHAHRGPLRLSPAHHEDGRCDLPAVGAPPDAHPVACRSLDAVEPLSLEAPAADRRAALGPAPRGAHLGSQEGPRPEQPAAPAPRAGRDLRLAHGRRAIPFSR